MRRDVSEITHASAKPLPMGRTGPSTGCSDSRASRGWHTIQMAVLGFLGICGVLRGSSSSIRSAVQRLPAILARPLGHRAPKYRPQRDRLPTPCSIASPSRGRAAQRR